MKPWTTIILKAAFFLPFCTGATESRHALWTFKSRPHYVLNDQLATDQNENYLSPNMPTDIFQADKTRHYIDNLRMRYVFPNSFLTSFVEVLSMGDTHDHPRATVQIILGEPGSIEKSDLFWQFSNMAERPLGRLRIANGFNDLKSLSTTDLWRQIRNAYELDPRTIFVFDEMEHNTNVSSVLIRSGLFDRLNELKGASFLFIQTQPEIESPNESNSATHVEPLFSSFWGQLATYADAVHVIRKPASALVYRIIIENKITQIRAAEPKRFNYDIKEMKPEIERLARAAYALQTALNRAVIRELHFEIYQLKYAHQKKPGNLYQFDCDGILISKSQAAEEWQKSLEELSRFY